MNGTEIAAIVVAVTGLLGMLGKGASSMIALLQQQLRDTIEAKNAELKGCHERVELLEARLRKAGIDV